MKTNTPETDDIASMRRTTTEWREHSERLERERNEARKDLLDLKREMEWCLDWAPDDSQAEAKRIMAKISAGATEKPMTYGNL
jgi:hypothetical protein